MGLEIELKARLTDRKSVEARIVRMGAKRIGEEKQTDTYFDIRTRKAALRLRTVDAHWTLTFKGPSESATIRSREELESKVQSGSEIAKILERVGLPPYLEIRKQRSLYKLQKLVICIDRVKGLGTFLEIEANRNAAKSKIFDLFTRLCIPSTDIVTKTYVDLMSDNQRSLPGRFARNRPRC